MNHMVKSILLFTAFSVITEGMSLNSETVQFRRNDISDNVISREYSDSLQCTNIRKLEFFQTSQLLRIVPQNFPDKLIIRKKYLDKIKSDVFKRQIPALLKIKNDLKITQKQKKKKIEKLQFQVNKCVKQKMQKWDEYEEELYMRNIMPKLIKAGIEKELQNTEFVQNYSYSIQGMQITYNTKIDELNSYYKCNKFSNCFGNSNEYLVFVGDNPNTQHNRYEIKSILPKKYFDKPTRIALTIPGNIDGYEVHISNKVFFRFLHIKEELVANVRLKIFLEDNVYLTEGLSSMFDDFMYQGNGLKLQNIEIGRVHCPKSEWDMSYAFRNCLMLEKLNLEKIDTTNVHTMIEVFKGCKFLREININNFNTSNVDNMCAMFEGCESLKELDLGKFNTVNVNDMSRMFCNCKTLKKLDLSNFDVSNTEHIAYMFAGCENLEELKINKRALMKLLDKDENIFEDCGNLKIIDATTGNEISLNSFYL